jgi:hypothetical protein
MLELTYCTAIRQNGPRRGQACGRTCYGTPYCTQYHLRGYERKQQRNQRNQEFLQSIRGQNSTYETATGAIMPVQPVRGSKQDTINALNKAIGKPKKRGCFQSLFACICLQEEKNIPDPNLPPLKHDTDCVICTCEPQEKEVWSKMNCGHVYHSQCIKEWIATFGARDKGCPLCRQEIIGNIDFSFITM